MSRTTTFGYAAALQAALFLTAGAATTRPASAAAFLDQLCPNASGAVTKYTALANNNDSTVVAVIDAAREVIAAYRICGSQDLSSGAVEPFHYTAVRQAQFYYQIGHLQHLTDDNANAKTSLKMAEDLTKETIDWTSSAQNVYRSNGTGGSGSTRGGATLPSTYRETAVAVRDAAEKELAEVNAPAASPSPAASPTP